MRLLVLGGTVFLSRAVAAAAVRRGHEVVCACRGRSGTVPDGARLVRWDRAEPAPAALLAEAYDAVVDVAGLPSQVRSALTALRDPVAPAAPTAPDAPDAPVGGAERPAPHWVFVSTVSVYADPADPAGPGAGRLLEEVVEDRDPMSAPEVYGGMKAACERLVREATASAAIVRPGLVVGPGDPSGRFAYWAARLMRADADPRVLAPGEPADPVQVIDVRDLADWLVTLAERRTAGVYDAVGHPTPVGELLGRCAPEATLAWAGHDFLTAHGVAPWAGPGSLPLWLPRPEYDGMLAHDPRPALDAGLRLRPVEETMRDTQAWLRADPAARVTGLDAERERELLALLSAPDARG